MKKLSKISILPVVVLMLALLSSSVTHAQSLKIGLVDFQQALNQSKKGKSAKANLKKQYEAKKRSVEAKKTALDKAVQKLKSQYKTLDPQTLAKKKAELQKQAIEINKLLAQYRQEMVRKEAEFTKTILTKAQAIVTEIGKAEKYTIIFEKSQGSVLYASSYKDITPQVISKLNK